MNSFKFLGEGMAAEIERQVGLLESGEPVLQETLHYDPARRELHARRSKEEADDYRYFPEPDLVPLEPSADDVERLRAALPELPGARIARFRDDLGLAAHDAVDLNATPAVAAYFEDVIAAGADAKAASDWVRNQPGAVEAVPAGRLAELIGLISVGTITATIAKQVYALLEAEPGADPAELVERHGLATVGDSSELDALVAQVIDSNPALVEQFRGGKDGVINALVGQVMKETRGRADARQVQELLRLRL